MTSHSEYTPPTIDVSEMDDDQKLSIETFSEDQILEYLEHKGFDVSPKLSPGSVQVTFTGSIQDTDLEEAITAAYAKHGHQLAELISNL